MDKRWEDIKTTVRTNINYDSDTLATERQWARRGYIAVDDTVGRNLWSNQFCERKKLKYLFDSEVRLGKKEELTEILKTESQKAEEKRRNNREIEDYIKANAKLEADNSRLIKQNAKLRKALKYQVNMLCKAMPIGEPIYDYIVIDTETTGLDSERDEILQLSIINSNNKPLMNRYFKPLLVENWTSAEKVHGISKDRVKNTQPIYNMATTIQQIINSTTKIVCYNAEFDLAFLKSAGIHLGRIKAVDDVMLMFAEIYGEYSDYYDEYKWQKLTTCAAYYDYDWSTTEAHNSLADCLATNYCYRKIMGIS